MRKEVWQTQYLRKAWDFVVWAIATVLAFRLSRQVIRHI